MLQFQLTVTNTLGNFDHFARITKYGSKFIDFTNILTL